MALAVHPKRAETVYVGYEGVTQGGGGVATTSDGGRSWRYRSIPDTIQVYSLAVAPSDPDTIYAGHALHAVVVDPERSETVYVGTDEHGVLRSTDGGATWRPFGAHLPRRSVHALALDPSGSRLYAGTNDAGLSSIRVR